jgi:gliding motility-associated-like protein
MKGSFIIVFLLEPVALLSGFALRAQQGRGQMSVVKNNFISFTRKYTDRGKLWRTKNKVYLHHPDANFGDTYSPNNSAVELFGKRTIDSKFFINKDTPSICYAQKSSGPMHFKKNGQWVTIDARLSPKGPLRYEASNQKDPLGFDIKRKSSYFITSDGRTYFNNWKLYGKNGGPETLLATADWSHYTAGDDGIAFKNIFPGIDAEMKVSRGSIETNFIVHANYFPTYKTLLFRDSFLSVHPGNFIFSNGVPGNGLASSADFRVGAKTLFNIKEGVMYLKEHPSSTYQFIPYYLDHNKLTLAINGDFLNAQVKTGDVIIDPKVQAVGTLRQKKINGSYLNPLCNLVTACEYHLSVPAPPAATIIDALFSFGFTANAPCIGQNAAFSFAINAGCSSQVRVGNSTGTGSQFFTNQSMLLNNGGSLTGCFPKPACGLPPNIPFTFYFYRECNGPAGCDGSCIGAAEDLTITLVGRSFDSASVSASPKTICAGDPVTLTARGYYGVAPYNFMWQGTPQYNGDSVIHVNPKANSVYTVQVSGSCPSPDNRPVTVSTAVVVNPILSPKVNITSSATNICAGAAVSFTANVSNAGNSPTYQWLLNGNKTGTNTPKYSSSSFVNNDAVSCVVSANGPCVAGPDTSNSIVLVVNKVVTPTFNGIGPLCINSTAPPLPPTSKEGIAGTWTPASINTSVLGTTTYKFTPSSAGNCSPPASLNVAIVNLISPSFPTIADSYCLNDPAPGLPTTSKEGVKGTWSPASINTASPGRTSYNFTPAAGQCAATSQIAVVVNPLPALIMGSDLTIAPGASTILNVSVTGNIVSYHWDPSIGLSDPTIKDPVASPSSTTVYTLDIIDDNKCEASGSIKITVSGGGSRAGPKILVPNAFSPNGDGVNDTWVITNLSAYPGATVDVFNRYGQRVFHSENASKDWDGTLNGSPLPMGTYYYVIEPKNNEKKIAGSVTIFK